MLEEIKKRIYQDPFSFDDIYLRRKIGKYLDSGDILFDINDHILLSIAARFNDHILLSQLLKTEIDRNAFNGQDLDLALKDCDDYFLDAIIDDGNFDFRLEYGLQLDIL